MYSRLQTCFSDLLLDLFADLFVDLYVEFSKRACSPAAGGAAVDKDVALARFSLSSRPS